MSGLFCFLQTCRSLHTRGGRSENKSRQWHHSAGYDLLFGELECIAMATQFPATQLDSPWDLYISQMGIGILAFSTNEMTWQSAALLIFYSLFLKWKQVTLAPSGLMINEKRVFFRLKCGLFSLSHNTEIYWLCAKLEEQRKSTQPGI